MEEAEKVSNLSSEQELIYDTILSFHKAGWKQYIDCNNLTIKLVKNNKSFVFRIDSFGELYLVSCRSTIFEDLEEVEEIFDKLIKEVNLFFYFKEYVDSFERFLFLEELFTLADKDFMQAGGIINFEQS